MIPSAPISIRERQQAIEKIAAAWRYTIVRGQNPVYTNRDSRLEVDAVVGEIEGYVAIWGSHTARDSYETWFDISLPPEMGLDLVPFAMCYEHATNRDGMPQRPEKIVVGRIVSVWFDDIGVRFRAYLDVSHDLCDKLIRDIKLKKLFTSSAAAEHTATWDDEGRFRTWLLDEVSLTEFPAESRIPAVELIRSKRITPAVVEGKPRVSDYGGPNAIIGLSPSRESNAMPPSLQDLGLPADVTAEQLIQALINSGTSPDDIMSLLQQYMQPSAAGSMSASPTQSDPAALPAQTTAPAMAAGGALPAALPSAVSAIGQEQIIAALQALIGGAQQQSPVLPRSNPPTDLRAMIEQARSRMAAPPVGYTPVTRQTAAPVAPRSQDIRVIDKFQHMTPSQMALGYVIMTNMTNGKRAEPPTEEYVRAMTYKAAIAAESNDVVCADYAVRSIFPGQRESRKPLRANEVMQSTLAGFGDEWVSTLMDTNLWLQIRAEANAYQTMISKGMVEAEIPQGYEAETIPLEGADPTFYVTGQSTDEDSNTGMPKSNVASSKFGTGNKTLTVAKLSAVILYNQELIEDSIVNVAAEAERKLRVAGAEQIDTILINGDTATGASVNINLIDGTPAASPNQPAYTLLNGLFKLPLVTKTANSLDCSAALNEAVFLNIMKKFPKKYRQNKAALLYLVDSDVALAALNMSTVKTRDVFTAATIEEGILTRIWKVDVLESAFIQLANSVGKVDAAIDGTLGRIGCVRPDQWVSRWKRRIRTDVTYFARADTTEIVLHMRWGLGSRDNDAATIGYNVAVTIA